MKVVGFHNRCPIVEFQYRYVHICSHTAYHLMPHVMYCVYIFKINKITILLASVRRGQMLNVRGEKVSEALFLHALKKAVSQWPGAQLVDYCCAESGIMGETSRFYPSVPPLSG